MEPVRQIPAQVYCVLRHLQFVLRLHRRVAGNKTSRQRALAAGDACRSSSQQPCPALAFSLSHLLLNSCPATRAPLV
nr:hypothetical protein CFP56_69134 [Quercus suber]